ncbi:hypothetical protein D3C87_23210 [compost metagenome]
MLCPGKKFFFLFDVSEFNYLKGSGSIVFLNLFICLSFFGFVKKQRLSGALPNNTYQA